MGEIRNYYCTCGYEKRLFVGGGMNGIRLDIIRKIFPADLMDAFEKEQASGNVTSYLMENAVIQCSNCKELHSVPWFHYQLKNGQQKNYILSCPSCKGNGQVIQEINHISCPRCNTQMAFLPTGHWD